MSTPAPPADLIDDVSRSKFAEIAAKVSAKGELTPFQNDLIRSYSDAYALRARAVADLQAGPIVVTGSNGNTYPRPELKVIQQAESQMDRVLRRLQVDADASAADDGFDAF